MKSIISLTVALVAVFTGNSAHADLTIVRSALEGTATELPGGILQVYEPRIKIGENSYSLHRLKGSKKMEQLACGLIGKKAISSTTKEIFTDYNFRQGRFDGFPVVLKVHNETIEPGTSNDGPAGNYGAATYIIDTLTCH